MKISPIIYVPLLHVILLSVLSGYYLPLLFSDTYPRYLTLIIANSVIVFVSYKIIKQWNILPPRKEEKRSNRFWFLSAIFMGVIHYFGLFFPTIINGFFYFESVEELQSNLSQITNFPSYIYFPDFSFFWGTGFYLIYLFIGAVTEEYIYRRFLFSYCLRKNVFFALIISSVVFNLIHTQREFIPYHLNTALTFAILYYLSGKLWIPIVSHFFFNTMGIIGFLLLKSNFWAVFLWIYPLCYILGYSFSAYYLAKLSFENTKVIFFTIFSYLFLSLILTVAGFMGIADIEIFVI